MQKTEILQHTNCPFKCKTLILNLYIKKSCFFRWLNENSRDGRKEITQLPLKMSLYVGS